jgi:zinc transport system substrate-binding protein
VARSAIYFRIGYMEFETTLVRNIQAQNRKLKFVNTAGGVDLIAAEIVDHGDHVHAYGVDPHIWLSIPAVKIQVKHMYEAIADADPANREFYSENYNAFMLELDEFHASLTDRFSGCRRKSFLIFHPALGYFARDYGLVQIPIEMDGKSPSAANIRNVIDIAREDDIKDVFIQMEFERESARAVARELGGGIIELDPLSEDWLQNMKAMADVIYESLNN